MATEIKNKHENLTNNFVLVRISGGLINQVNFYDNRLKAIKALSNFVKTMDPENEDAGVYDKDKLIANAKNFLDENDEFIENPEVFERL